MIDVTESSPNEKKRMLQLSGVHFDYIDGGDNSNLVPLSDEMLTNKFSFSLNQGEVTSITHHSGQSFQILFDSFHDDMELTVSLLNATLEETFYSATSSTISKILRPNTVTIPIANATTFSPELVEAVGATGQVIGQAQGLTEKGGASIALIAILLNVRFSGPLVKAIQIIVLFDKLRLINVRFDGLLGYFLEKIFQAFDSNIISKDDYVQTAKPAWNKF
jgi:hypothetical protein